MGMRTTLAATLDGLVDRVERLEWLDKPSDAVAPLLRKALPEGVVEDTLSGTPIAHPVHPMLVTVPLGAWSAATLLDFTGADAKATKRLVGIGILTALPASATGANDWLTTSGAERRLGAVHAVVNYGTLGLQLASWRARGRGKRLSGTLLSAMGLGLSVVGGWLGGHLVYAMGVGPDTTAYQQLPTEWTDALPVSEVSDGLAYCEIDGVPFVLYRSDGEIVALADRCTHRGGPLHEGTLANGCVTCPWHGSTFGPDGSVRSGPATRPQPELQVRVVDGRVQVRRDEPRTLRTNPAGR
jgi:nitrite reductase/ring-hydroxylating ferredoxin subunit/uncharacterized membrane protein